NIMINKIRGNKNVLRFTFSINLNILLRPGE
ncbi:unnamed protein product, partial [marine sediment metagenome]